jgi:hypothetical protein
MPTPRLLVEIATSLGTFESDFSKASGIADQHARKISKSLDDIKRVGLDLGKSIAAAIGVPLTAGALLDFYKEIVQRTSEAERSVNALNAVIKATGSGAGLTVGNLEGINKDIQGSTVFNSGEIRTAETALLRFRTVQQDVYRDAIRLTPDLATALGRDLPSAAEALGRALANPSTGLRLLREAGLRLTQQQIDMAARMSESGDDAGAQKLILDELRKSIGGSAESDASGLYGSTKRLSRAWGDLLEEVGKQGISSNRGPIDELTAALERLRKKAEESPPTLRDLFTPFGGLGTSIGQIRALLNLDNASPGAAGSRDTGIRPIANVGLSPDQEEAADAAREARINQRLEAAYTRGQELIKARAASAAAELTGQLQNTQDFLARQSALYDFAYSQDTISTKAFYDNARQEAQASFRAQHDLIAGQIAAQEQLLNPANTGIKPEERDAARKQILTLANADQKNYLDLGQRVLALDIQQAGAVEKLKDQYAGLSVTLQQLRGDTVSAAAASFDLANKDLNKRLASEISSGDPLAQIRAQAAKADLDAIRQLTIQQAALNKLTTDYSVITDAIGIKQSRIDLLQQTGAITELDALKAKGDAAQALIPKLTAIADAYEKIAIATKDPTALLAVDKLRLEIDQLAAQSDAAAKKFRDIFSGAVADGITEFVTGAKSLKDSLKDIANSINQQLVHVAAQNVGEQLFGKNGPLGGVSDFLAKAFGGKNTLGLGSTASADASIAALGTTATVTSTGLDAVALAAQSAAAALQAVAASGGGAGGAGGLGDLFGGGGNLFGPNAIDVGDNFAGGIPFFASGTSFAPGGPSIVGERGPELVNLPRGSQVIPNDKLGGKSTTVHQSVYITVPGNTTTKTAAQIGVEVGRATRRSLERFG